MKKITLLICLSIISIGWGQVPTQSEPKSFSFQEGIDIPVHRLNEFNVDSFLLEDERDQTKVKPYRFANPIQVDLNMKNSGLWTILNDGSKIWQLIIQSPNAYSLLSI